MEEEFFAEEGDLGEDDFEDPFGEDIDELDLDN